jgi:hypothetical protein
MFEPAANEGVVFRPQTSHLARKNSSMHIFEYQREILYMFFRHGLIEATTKLE